MILCQFEDICKKYGLEICRSNFDKDVDTGKIIYLEQESVIASGSTTCHAGKSSALAE